jgi:hypothetical protein
MVSKGSEEQFQPFEIAFLEYSKKLDIGTGMYPIL